MRRLRVRPVHIVVHPDFYRMFDASRSGYSKSIGIDISNIKYTEILARSNVNLLPKKGGTNDYRKKRRRF